MKEESLRMARQVYEIEQQGIAKMADYFDEDLTIFLGLEGYRKPLQLSGRERELLENYRRLSDAAQTRADETIGDMAANPKNRR